MDNKLGVNDVQQHDELISCCIISVLCLGLAHPLLFLMAAGSSLLFAPTPAFPASLGGVLQRLVVLLCKMFLRSGWGGLATLVNLELSLGQTQRKAGELAAFPPGEIRRDWLG